MRSSTSSFSSRDVRVATIVLIATLTLFCFGLEAAARLLYGRFSRIRSRLESEHRSALAIGQEHADQAEVLIVGNSLLLHGINYEELQKTVGPDLKVTRFVVESTGYLDWYYGLRHIFNRGGRPSVVVLVLSPRQLLSHNVEGDLFANLMLDRKDVLSVSRETGAGRTTITNLYLDTFSDFYGNRAEIRNWILHVMMPGAERVRDFIRPQSSPLREDEASVALASSRLAQIRALTSCYGAQFVLTVPPQLSGEGLGTLQEASRRANVVIWTPVRPGELPSSKFSDGYHLNADGATVFTAAFVRNLMQLRLHAQTRAESVVPTASPFEPLAPQVH